MKIRAAFYVRASSAVASLGDEGLCLRSFGSRDALPLRGPAALVWTMADGSHSIYRVVCRVAKQFQMSHALAKRAVEGSLAQLWRAGVFLPAQRIDRAGRIVNEQRREAKLPAGPVGRKRG